MGKVLTEFAKFKGELNQPGQKPWCLAPDRSDHVSSLFPSLVSEFNKITCLFLFLTGLGRGS